MNHKWSGMLYVIDLLFTTNAVAEAIATVAKLKQ
jgi:hypothetical protein